MRATPTRIGLNLIDLYCRSYTRPPQAITLDIDDTDDPAHGQQELALFNAHFGCTCFQPIHIFEAGSGKPILSLTVFLPSFPAIATMARAQLERAHIRLPCQRDG